MATELLAQGGGALSDEGADDVPDELDELEDVDLDAELGEDVLLDDEANAA